MTSTQNGEDFHSIVESIASDCEKIENFGFVEEIKNEIAKTYSNYEDTTAEKMAAFTFRTGKHVGKTFFDVAREDASYSAWVYKRRQEITYGSMKAFAVYLTKLIDNTEKKLSEPKASASADEDDAPVSGDESVEN